MREFTGKMPQAQKDPKTAAHTVCEPAQSKYTWTFHKSHFIRKFTGKCWGAQWAQNADTYFVRACGRERHLDISQEPLYTEIYRKSAAAQMEHPDQAPAFTPTARTPQCGHTVLGKNILWGLQWASQLVNACYLSIKCYYIKSKASLWQS